MSKFNQNTTGGDASFQESPAHSGAVLVALHQARRARRRGRHRKAMLLLRKAAYQDRESATLWNRYALSCLRDGHKDDALKAFAHSIWLDRRQGNQRRAEITQGLADKAAANQLDLH